MIASLRGVVAEKGVDEAVIDVGGVGYRVALSVLCAAQLPAVGAQVQVRVRTIVREDALDLYGFLSRPEEALFLLLTSVSHVGPKVAMGVLSGLDVESLAAAIAKGDVARLTKIRGVGRKTAERIVLELREQAKRLTVGTEGGAQANEEPASGDLVSALLNLGYHRSQAESAARATVKRLGDDAAFEALLREALKALRGG